MLLAHKPCVNSNIFPFICISSLPTIVSSITIVGCDKFESDLQLDCKKNKEHSIFYIYKGTHSIVLKVTLFSIEVGSRGMLGLYPVQGLEVMLLLGPALIRMNLLESYKIYMVLQKRHHLVSD